MSLFADFVARGGQWWPLNVSVGWGDRTSSCERRQHNTQNMSEQMPKDSVTNHLCCFGGGNASTCDGSGATGVTKSNRGVAGLQQQI